MKDGTLAFPRASGPNNSGDPGMLLRDWLAGQFAAATVGGLVAAQISTDPDAAVNIAKASYILADAMLEARK